MALIPDGYTAAEWKKVQTAKASAKSPGSPVPIFDGSVGIPANMVPSGPSGSASGPSIADLQAAADAKATAAANTAARSSANQAKSQYQQSIDANLAQMTTNTDKLDALRELIANGLTSARDTNLGSVSQNLATILAQMQDHYGAQLGDVNTSLRGNEKAESDSSFSNLANRAREKQDLVTQALSQGAGESDILKTQLQALRNWDANQGEVNRSYFDTLASTNAVLTDLNSGTQSNMLNTELDANAKRGQIWNDYYGSISDAYTQMDNLASNNWLLEGENAAARTNMSQQDALLSWVDSGKNAADFVHAAATPAARAAYDGFADEAADYAGRAWADPGASEETKNWQGQQKQVGALNNSQGWAAQTNSASTGTVKKKPEGATLRRW